MLPFPAEMMMVRGKKSRPTLVGVTSQNTVTTGSITLAKPAGVLPTDLLIAVLGHTWTSAYSLPSGWTLAARQSGAVAPMLHVAYASGSVASTTFSTIGVSSSKGGSLLAYRNAAWDTAGAVDDDGGSLSGIDVSENESILFMVEMESAASKNHAGATGFSDVDVNSDSTGPSWAVHAKNVNAGPTGTITADPVASVLFSIKPVW